VNAPMEPAAPTGQADDAAREYVAGRVKAGASREAIVQELLQRGYEPAVAQELVKGQARQHASSARQSGLLMLLGGIVLTIVGIAITVGSYSTASQQGGTYLICWGLPLFGIYLAIRGALQLVRGREVK
jgi:hypothetical protein